MIPAIAIAADRPDNSNAYDKGYRFDRDGWIYVHIEGGPFERGYQHGYLVAPELAEIIRSLKYLTLQDTGMSWEFFVNASEKAFPSHMDQEYLEEIKGIAAGANARGVNITWQEVLAWNGYDELVDYWWPTVKEGVYTKDKEHCSAFIATGSYTRDGKIVMAHNNWDSFEIGQFSNLIMDLVPEQGSHMFMQSAPGIIDSGSDFFVTDSGIMGSETTIGGFNKYSENKTPEFIRVRKAIQYADTLDQWTSIMMENNSGGYANGWFLGDINTGEIMQFELGLNYSNITRMKDGYFIGYNEAKDPRIRNLECDDPLHLDIRAPSGARQVRLTQLMREDKGKIDVEVAKAILADHYDVYLKKENPGSRTIDGHYELDPRADITIAGRPPYQPKGAVDGKAIDSDLARNMSFQVRWGNSAGMPFDAEEFLNEHIQYEYLRGYLKDRPAEPWTQFTANASSVGGESKPNPA
jgi:hypothetical protein